MSDEWRALSDEKLARIAQDGLQAQGAPVEAMRRLRVALETASRKSDTYSRRTLWLTIVLGCLDAGSGDCGSPDHHFHVSASSPMSLETALYLIFILALVVVAIYEFRKRERKNRELNRAVEERIQREAAAKERSRIYNENYQREEKALRKSVLDDLKAIACGEKRRLDPETMEAAKKIMERQGVNNPGMAENHPEIVKPWTTLIDDLSAETLEDAKAIQDRLADLLYPETLEDVEALKTLQSEGLKKISLGEKPNPEHLDAAKALNEIRARDMQRRREEQEAEERERALKRKQEEQQTTLVDEMMKSSAKNITRMYGLPEDVFEDMRPEEVAMHARFLRLSHKFAHLPAEEREARTLEELEKELEQERQERNRHTE
jgi:hypothetical protein